MPGTIAPSSFQWQIVDFRSSHAILTCATTHRAPPLRHAGPLIKEKRDTGNQSDVVFISVVSPAPGLSLEVKQPRSGRGNHLILWENML